MIPRLGVERSGGEIGGGRGGDDGAQTTVRRDVAGNARGRRAVLRGDVRWWRCEGKLESVHASERKGYGGTIYMEDCDCADEVFGIFSEGSESDGYGDVFDGLRSGREHSANVTRGA